MAGSAATLTLARLADVRFRFSARALAGADVPPSTMASSRKGSVVYDHQESLRLAGRGYGALPDGALRVAGLSGVQFFSSC